MRSLSNYLDMAREAAWMVEFVVIVAWEQNCHGILQVSIVPSPAAALCCKKTLLRCRISSHYLQSLPDMVSPHSDGRENWRGFRVHDNENNAFSFLRRLHRADVRFVRSMNNLNRHMSVTITCDTSSAHI